MFEMKKPLALILALGAAWPATAQEAAPEAPATEAPAADAPAEGALSLGEPAGDQIGASYSAAIHGDWDQRCLRTESGIDPCELYQLLKDAEGNAVAEISIFGLNDGGDAVAGATIVTPLETLLTANITLSVDNANPRRYPFNFCAVQGCVSRVGFTDEEVESFKKGNIAKLVIVPAVAPDKTVDLTMSLKGFTDGYAAVNEANAKVNAAAAEAAPKN